MTQSSLVTAMQDVRTVTENGMPTNETSGRDLLDAFFRLGASRKEDDQTIRNLVIKSYNENPMLALKLFAYNRDVRGGQGERRAFRIAFRYLAESHPVVARQLIPFVPFYGRFDDLFVAMGTPIETDVLDFYGVALIAENGLAAKWAPREKKANAKNAEALRKHMGLSRRDYRKKVASLSSTVEDAMCAKDWSNINYSHVPSVAANRYRKAFAKNDTARYGDYLKELAKPAAERDPSVKVNADAIFPHTIAKPFIDEAKSRGRYFYGQESVVTDTDKMLLEAQWDALPEYLPEDSRTLGLVDVSASMDGEPMEVAIALGLYLSERLTGAFKDTFLTFSGTPKLERVHGKLGDRISQMHGSQWGYNTNLEAAFRAILNAAIRHTVPQSDMPTTLIIFSDMQFDQAVQNGSHTAVEMMRQMYANAGYKLPNVVFWNLRAAAGSPARFDEAGTALVSGFSPSTMKLILNGKMNPMDQMLSVLNSERYERIESIVI